jgi:hypothetical protein
MKRYFFFSVIFLLALMPVKAQIRIGLLAGTALPTDGKKNDTAFFGNRHLSQQLKIGIHKGKLGFTVGGALIQQTPGDVVADGRLPKLDQGGNTKYEFAGGKVNTTMITAGPEICFPLGKLKMHVRVAGGLATTTATPVTIRNATAGQAFTFYSTSVEKSNTGVMQAGLSFQYPILKKLSLTVNSDYLGYKIKYNSTDRRSGPNTITKEQSKKLVNLMGGLTYKF